MAGRQFSAQTSLSSPVAADYPATSQVESESPQWHLYAVTRELDSLADSMYWTGGHVIDDGYDLSADRLDDRSVPEPEMGEKKWNDDDENNMSGAGKGLEAGDDDRDFYSGFPVVMEARPAEEAVSQTSPVAPPPPPPPLPAPVLAPVPSANFHLTGRGAKSFPTVKVFGARARRASRC